MQGPSIFKNRIARQFIWALVAFSSFITLVTTGTQLVTDYRRDVTGIETSIGLIQSSYLEAVTQSIWAFDEVHLAIHLNGLMAIPDIEFVGINRKNGGTLSSGTHKSKNVISHIFPITHHGKFPWDTL